MTVPFSKPRPGQNVGPFIADTAMWSLLLDMVNDYRAGRLTSSPEKRTQSICTPIGRNQTDLQKEFGDLQQLGDILPPGTAIGDPHRRLHQFNPQFPLEDPVWHTAIDLTNILGKNILARSQAAIGNERHLPIKVSVIDPEDRWVMINPLDTTELVTSTGGFFKLLGIYDDDVAIIDTQESQPLWLYELTNNPADGVAEAKILRLDGNVFAPTALVSFPLGSRNEVIGDKGWCTLVGNKFYSFPMGKINCQDVCDCLCECDQFAIGNAACCDFNQLRTKDGPWIAPWTQQLPDNTIPATTSQVHAELGSNTQYVVDYEVINYNNSIGAIWESFDEIKTEVVDDGFGAEELRFSTKDCNSNWPISQNDFWVRHLRKQDTDPAPPVWAEGEDFIDFVQEIYDGDPDAPQSTLLASWCERIYYDAPQPDPSGKASITAGDSTVDIGTVKAFLGFGANCPEPVCGAQDCVAPNSLPARAVYMITGMRVIGADFQDIFGNAQYAGSILIGETLTPCQHDWSVTFPFGDLNGTRGGVLYDIQSGITFADQVTAQQKVQDAANGLICLDEVKGWGWRENPAIVPHAGPPDAFFWRREQTIVIECGPDDSNLIVAGTPSSQGSPPPGAGETAIAIAQATVGGTGGNAFLRSLNLLAHAAPVTLPGQGFASGGNPAITILEGSGQVGNELQSSSPVFRCDQPPPYKIELAMVTPADINLSGNNGAPWTYNAQIQVDHIATVEIEWDITKLR